MGGWRRNICEVTWGGQHPVEREVALVDDGRQQQARGQAGHQQGEGEAVGSAAHVDAAAEGSCSVWGGPSPRVC